MSNTTPRSKGFFSDWIDMEAIARRGGLRAGEARAKLVKEARPTANECKQVAMRIQAVNEEDLG